MTVSGKGQVARLVLIGEGGQAEPMSEAALIHLLRVLKDNLRLVFLSACHSNSLAKDLADVIPYTIGMGGAIPDDAAIAFGTAFYRALGFGRNLQEAFDLGQNALMNLDVPEDQRPRFYCRKDVLDPSKVVLIGSPVAPSWRRVAGADRNRAVMLEKVRTIWITGFLQKSLFQETRIVLGLAERPDAVARPLDLLVRRPDQGDRPLPAGTQVVDVFDSMDQGLLILGAPGAGKTTLLLELARDLITRAGDDPAYPVTVVYPLSTWSASRKPLVEWLADELNLRYDVPRKLAQAWVESDQILPLLDGLDEVKAEYRRACVKAINDFRRSHGLLPLVITSRTADYEALPDPLRLQGAIVVRPLTHEHVNAYLSGLGPAGEKIRAATDEDRSLWELLDSPLLLNILAVAYAGQRDSPLPMSQNVAERRGALFASYVNQVLHRSRLERRFTPDQTVHWLSWLASAMAYHGQTVFYLERLQKNWIPQEQRQTIRMCSGLVVGLVLGLVFGLVFGLAVGLVLGLLFGADAVADKDIRCAGTIQIRWSKVSYNFRRRIGCLPYGLSLGLFLGLVGGLFDWLFVGLYGRVFGRLLGGLFGGLLLGLVSLLTGLVAGLVGGLSIEEIETRPKTSVIRSSSYVQFT
jgi:hypothetical protein